jgi:predicted esterase
MIMTATLRCGLCAALFAAWIPLPLTAQDDVAAVPAQDLRADKDEKMRYFLIGPMPEVKTPKEGFGLIIVLPGGDGSAEFNPFVKRIFKYALPETYLIAQPVAVKWSPKQQITWPTEKVRVPGMKFSTEKFVGAVIKDAAAKKKLDPERIFTLSWSSGGPAAYACSLSDKKIKGSFVAMSVFKSKELPPLTNAKGRSYFLYHSPQDRICPIWMARLAVKDLGKNGAKVKLATYQGGHGWRGPLYNDIRAGIKWLEGSRARAPDSIGAPGVAPERAFSSRKKGE